MSLTDQERAIISLLAQGQTAKRIARELTITPRTVEHQLENCRHKLGARNNTHLVAVAALRGDLRG